jgi:hypothetical protein
LFLLGCWINLSGQSHRFVFYNVENMFHPSWDSLNPDREFTPEGRMQWTIGKYYLRLHRLSKVILNMSDTNYRCPALVGLCEIESEQVLIDLLDKTSLQKLNYQYVHYDSPDRRGIDVALIPKPWRFQLGVTAYIAAEICYSLILKQIEKRTYGFSYATGPVDTVGRASLNHGELPQPILQEYL